uniref:Plectrovirus spv1-c74 orf 4 n-terminal truncated protein n=1 Tax=Spiroplasma citri TaxID=2133 RepID=Q14PV0_SPICI|nr:plectrovirus spv1-c74 orf 4 n-terminal truncated protein [Spiroplasma citri]
MKKLNKKTISKINELMLRSYPVSKDDTTGEHWTLGKQNYFTKMKKALFSSEPKKEKTNNNNLTNWSVEKEQELINDLESLN